jgi:hypothetical protein
VVVEPSNVAQRGLRDDEGAEKVFEEIPSPIVLAEDW